MIRNGLNTFWRKVVLAAFLLMESLCCICYGQELPKKSQPNPLKKQLEQLPTGFTVDRRSVFKIIPTYSNRKFWKNIPKELKANYIKQAEQILDWSWPSIKASDYLAYRRGGDARSEIFWRPTKYLSYFAIAELIEGKGRFLDQIANGLWYFNERTWWGWSSHVETTRVGQSLPLPNSQGVDLGVGEAAVNVALALFIFEKELNNIDPAIVVSAREALWQKGLTPFFNNDNHLYLGLAGERSNNWNTWINHNMLLAWLLTAKNAGIDSKPLLRTIRSLESFIDNYPEDGSCEEGPVYWGVGAGLLIRTLTYIAAATDNHINIFNDPKLKRMASYILNMHIGGKEFLNFGDADRISTGDILTIYQAGRALSDSRLVEFSRYLYNLRQPHAPLQSSRLIDEILYIVALKDLVNTESTPPLIGQHWYSNSQMVVARENAGSTQGMFFAARGGNNGEFHNHNDIGSFVLYYNSKPVLIDVGREEYTRKTFQENERYNLWNISSEWHSVPFVNGQPQGSGSNFRATTSGPSVGENSIQLAFDISAAYSSKSSINYWKRDFDFRNKEYLKVVDSFSLNHLSKDSGPTGVSLISACPVTVKSSGLLCMQCNGDQFSIDYDPTSVTPQVEEKVISDLFLMRYWKSIWRIRLMYNKQNMKGEISVIIKPRNSCISTSGRS
jgi:hypothetical protein